MSKNKLVFIVVSGVLAVGLMIPIFSKSVKSESTRDEKNSVNIISENPDDKSSIVLLKYAFWIVHSKFDYNIEKTNRLKLIADGFKAQGALDLYQTVDDLYAKYKPKSSIISLDTPAITHNKKWLEVSNLVLKEKDYDQATKLSDNDPFALATIASHLYADTRNKAKTTELLDQAYKQIQPNMKDRAPILRRIMKTYVEMEEFPKAYQMYKDGGLTELWGSQSLPLIEYFSKKQELDTAFELMDKTLFVEVKAEGLICIAKYIDNDKPLDRKYKLILENLLRSVSR